jgi:hypothetical protein
VAGDAPVPTPTNSPGRTGNGNLSVGGMTATESAPGTTPAPARAEARSTRTPSTDKG